MKQIPAEGKGCWELMWYRSLLSMRQKGAILATVEKVTGEENSDSSFPSHSPDLGILFEAIFLSDLLVILLLYKNHPKASILFSPWVGSLRTA